LISSSIKDHNQVLELLNGRPKYLETFTTYAPAHRFIQATVKSDSLSFSVRDEDGSIFAMALGEKPDILECDRLATSREVQVDNDLFIHRADWDFYSIDTDNFANSEKSEVASNDQEIEALLKAHAPNSSVWPGNEEILFWGSIREEEKLVATGALVKWRTGQVMFASIATHTDFRGRGLAQKLISRMLSSVEALGVKHVGLGVFAQNYSAKRAYEQVGFELIGEFSSYSRI
jgi:RimJ/RimL family protein N-acetyltransferase